MLRTPPTRRLAAVTVVAAGDAHTCASAKGSVDRWGVERQVLPIDGDHRGRHATSRRDLIVLPGGVSIFRARARTRPRRSPPRSRSRP